MKAYIGDLCYILSDAEWDTLCDLVNAKSEEWGGVFTINGKRLALYNTLYGDGQYTDSQGRVYLVDSGTIGIVLVDDDQAEVKGGHLHNVTESAISRFSVDDGTFHVGTLDGEVLIRTGYEEEEEEEDYEDYEEDDDEEGEEDYEGEED